MITQPRSAVALQSITIEIPIGAEANNRLPADTNLPGPVYDTSIPWDISATGSTVTIRPKSGSSGELTNNIYFTLPGIIVTQVQGLGPITITESAPVSITQLLRSGIFCRP